MPPSDIAVASRFARIALAGVTREYPHKPDHVLTSSMDARTPRQLHPVFYGCYDWHSAVHTHWLMARLRRTVPLLPERDAIDRHFHAHFQPDLIRAELNYAADPQRIAFERPYGWAWMFKLAEELYLGADGDTRTWEFALRPLAAHFALRLMDWLPRQQYAVRSGVHSNTAFMLGFAIDYARALGNSDLETTVVDASLRLFANDRAAPVAFEPSGHDFISPSLVEADLMRRIMSSQDFAAWLELWLPDLANSHLLAPVEVSDRGDPHGGHLDGLNFSRAWCLRGLASAGVRGADLFLAAADDQIASSLSHVESGDFLGEHWIATFALYAMTAGAMTAGPGKYVRG